MKNSWWKIGLKYNCKLLYSIKNYKKLYLMKIRNPFKNYLGQWKDDVSTKEKIIWSFFIVVISIAFFNIFIFPAIF